MNTLERIRRLIALAGGPNENEARNAAYLACRLIRENKIQLVPPGVRFHGPVIDSFTEMMQDILSIADDDPSIDSIYNHVQRKRDNSHPDVTTQPTDRPKKYRSQVGKAKK